MQPVFPESSSVPSATAGRPGWCAADIPFDCIDIAQVRDDETLFFVLASASLVESGSDLYTSTLVQYFEDGDVKRWLSGQWEPEELQHGRALRLYVEEVWPEFDWERAFENFMAEYSTYCQVAALAPTPALELAARCVVEAGTATLYRAIADATCEPILKRLAHNIQRDEVAHFRNFRRYFLRHNADGRHGRWAVLRTLAGRLIELRNEDSDCALRHIFALRYPQSDLHSERFRDISLRARNLVVRNLTPSMMVRMFLQPLQLPTALQASVEKPCSQAMQFFLSRRM